MEKVIHFSSPDDRMRYLKGKFEEIIPKEAEKKKVAKKKGKKKDEVQSE